MGVENTIMRKMMFIAVMLILLNPIIAYAGSLDNDVNIDTGNRVIAQAEIPAVSSEPVAPSDAINENVNQNETQTNQPVLPEQEEKIILPEAKTSQNQPGQVVKPLTVSNVVQAPTGVTRQTAAESSTSQKEAAPQSAPATQSIPTQIRSPKTNESLDKRLKDIFGRMKNSQVQKKQPGQEIASPTGTQPVQLPAGKFAPPSLSQPPAAGQNKSLFVSKGNVSLNFDDADIYSVIQTVFGEILKVNYIIDSRVKGRVTFRSVAPVAREKVLPLMEVILRLNGVAIIEESELYRIIPISDLSREPSEIKIGRKMIEADLKGKAVLQIVPLNYVQSSEIVKLISPFVSTNAVVVDVPKANHIIIADTDANVKRILNLIEYFDSEMKEKKGVRVFVHHVQNAKSKDIVTMLQQVYLGAKTQTTDRISKPSTGQTSVTTQTQSVVVSAQAGGVDAVVSDAVKIFADEKLNAVVILGTREDYDIIKQTINELDLVPRQVLIEGTIASILLTDKMNLGLAWSLKTSMGELNPINISFNPSTLTVDPAKPTAAGLNVIGVESGSTVRAVINALASQSKAKLLASPHITVSDNNEARIQVGQQVPIPTSETYSTTSTIPIRTIQYKDIGIILKVKPLINDSGLINLQISQEVSTYSTDILYKDEKQIILQKTEASTNLVVKDGHTIVIGGLIREDDSKSRSGIPWLSKIPILGYLFGNTENGNTRTELVILLTPYIIKNQEDVASITNKFTERVTDKEIIEGLQKNVHNGNQEPKEAEKKK